MKFLYMSCLLGMMAVASTCDRDVPINNIDDIPAPVPADSAYAHAFAKLDGTWQGTFYIYRDSTPGPRIEAQLKPPAPVFWRKPDIYLADSLLVTQQYQSITPFFQEVTITDYYPQRDETVVSKGVNKVQNGRLWCVVRKPDETVIHRGQLQGTNTIIWSRDERNPLKVEYFQETVEDSRYTIRGWGYYNGANPDKMPPFWFRATYVKQ